MNEDSLGYKRPPTQHRFKKGVSGNRKGRPTRKELSAEQIMAQTLESLMVPIKYKENGKIKSEPRLAFLLRKQAARAVQGDVGSAQFLLNMYDNVSSYDSARHYVIKLLPDDVNA